MAFARERKGLGVKSGISATAGERYVPMAMSKSPSNTMNTPSRPAKSANGRAIISALAATVPATMNGIRLPRRDWHRSDSVPNSGSKNSARMLSSAITKPAISSPREKRCLRIRGITKSYACQKAQMEKNARPIKNVRLLLSFTCHPPYAKARASLPLL